MDTQKEQQAEPRVTKRVDPPAAPTHPEFIRGNIAKEPGWHYQRVLVDDVDRAMLPEHLSPSGLVFPGWEVVHGAPLLAHAIDGKKDTVARDRDTIWMRCRDVDYALIERNQNRKNDDAAVRIGAGEQASAETVNMKMNVRTEG